MAITAGTTLTIGGTVSVTGTTTFTAIVNAYGNLRINSDGTSAKLTAMYTRTASAYSPGTYAYIRQTTFTVTGAANGDVGLCGYNVVNTYDVCHCFSKAANTMQVQLGDTRAATVGHSNRTWYMIAIGFATA